MAIKYVLYNYDPSLVAAVIFIAIFGLSALMHTYQLVRNRTWYFIPFLVGCLFETIGYVGRALSHGQYPDFKTPPYIMQSLLLLLGPALLAASIYMVLGRTIRLLNAGHLSIISPNWLTKVFVCGDVLSFFAQAGGGGMMAGAKTQSKVKLGEHVIVGGLGIQIIFFGFFMIVTLVFHMRIRSRPTKEAQELTVPWRQLLLVLYASSLLIMVRSVFRVAEYVAGRDSTLQSNEVYIYVFDATLMSITVVLYNWFHPSRVVNKNADRKRVASSDGYLMESQEYQGRPHSGAHVSKHSSGHSHPTHGHQSYSQGGYSS